MKYTVVLPYVLQEYKDACVATCKFDPDSMLLVDNTVKNVGIMRAHNMGIDKMMADGSDWLIVLSAAIRFGAPGGLDFVERLKEHEGHHVIEASGVFGWHLIPFSRELLEKVGRWDENFTPYGFDDIDYSLRIQKTFALDNSKQLWEKVPVDAEDAGMAHSIKIAKVESPADPLIDYFKKKWGRHPGEWQAGDYDRPFNKNVPIAYWPNKIIHGVLGTWNQPVSK